MSVFINGNFLQVLEAAIEGVRLAARIVDTPANEMDTAAFVEVRDKGVMVLVSYFNA